MILMDLMISNKALELEVRTSLYTARVFSPIHIHSVTCVSFSFN